MSEKKECDYCGSTNTYFTKKNKFCRSCGKQVPREDLIKEYIPKEIKEVKE